MDKIIKKSESLSYYTYSSQFEAIGGGGIPGDLVFDSLKIFEEKKELPDLFIEVQIKNGDKIRFNILSNEGELRKFAFNNNYFTNEELLKLSKVFGFQVVMNPFDNEKRQGTLSFIDAGYSIITPLIKKYNGRHYLLLYSSKRSHSSKSMSEDFYGDDTYYIHGVWEVELSEEFEKSIFKK